ncbi:molybdopterin synthase small subunit [Sulfuricella denitrificans skB26]|uniref:Molybdopterin synthase sulfur carrier subunit n=1 Tax=Sulfuricella denitrificans (strain DSM 22764 / NBRC 105220 / skB26) TaxID=1163617 RepID=S6AGG0_SULDS|nr:molybdopterin converting factor subunit 1 [Sulfuricella denitrificans]BAN35101.1 molybdopterin synthase small subunit [Sulfuricella denitrificans skB26]
MITLLYFARLRETFGLSSERANPPADVTDVRSLTEWLCQRGGTWQEELAQNKPVRVAVNQDIADPDTAVGDGDEVAFFPPVTGG